MCSSMQVNRQGLCSISPLRKSGRVTYPQSTDRVYTAFRLLESTGELLTHSQRTRFIQHFASCKVRVSYSPTVNGQGLYSISPLRKYGRVTHPQSTDRVYTVFRLKVWATYSPTVNGQGLCSISPRRKYGRVIHPQSTDRVYTVFRLLENMCNLLTHSNRQGLYSISPLGKYGRVTHPQSTDRVYTAFRLLESMGELLTHSQRIRVVHT